jgi:hypothetical protein
LLKGAEAVVGRTEETSGGHDGMARQYILCLRERIKR